MPVKRFRRSWPEIREIDRDISGCKWPGIREVTSVKKFGRGGRFSRDGIQKERPHAGNTSRNGARGFAVSHICQPQADMGTRSGCGSGDARIEFSSGLRAAAAGHPARWYARWNACRSCARRRRFARPGRTSCTRSEQPQSSEATSLGPQYRPRLWGEPGSCVQISHRALRTAIPKTGDSPHFGNYFIADAVPNGQQDTGVAGPARRKSARRIGGKRRALLRGPACDPDTLLVAH